MSIIDRNIKKLEASFLKTLEYVDLDYRDPAEVIAAGSVMINDLKLWLQSSKTDYCRRPDHGGFFDTPQKYSLNAIGADELKTDLTEQVTTQFPAIEIIDLKVEALVRKKGWRIMMAVRDSLTGVAAVVDSSLADV